MSHRSVPNESPRLRRSVLSCPASSATIKRSQPKRRSGASRKNDRRASNRMAQNIVAMAEKLKLG